MFHAAPPLLRLTTRSLYAVPPASQLISRVSRRLQGPTSPLGLACVVLCALLLGLGSCAPHIADMTLVRDEMARGNYSAANKLLEKGDEDDVLYLMERGLLCQYAGLFEESNEAFERAELLSEDLYTKSLSRETAALLTSDLILKYSGSDMERVMLNFYRALNYLNLGLPEDVLVECRKINEKLAPHGPGDEGGGYDDACLQYITGVMYEWGGELNDALVSYRAARRLYPQFSERYGVTAPATLRCDLERTATALGVSIPELEDDDAGKDHTVGEDQSAGAQQIAAASDAPDEEGEDLATAVSDAAHEPGEAPAAEQETASAQEIAGASDAAGQDRTVREALEEQAAGEHEAAESAIEERSADEEQPSGQQESLRRLEEPCTGDLRQGQVVLILELGFVAHKDEMVFHIPILEDERDLAEAYDKDFFMTLGDRVEGYDVGGREVAYLLSVAVPYYVRTEPAVRCGRLRVGRSQTETTKTDDLSAIAMRDLERRMPRILAKTAARALMKYLAKKSAEEAWGKLPGALIDIAGSATEHADTRSWLALPSEIHLARLSLPAGTYEASLELLDGAGYAVEIVDFGRIEVPEADVAFLHHRAP